MHLHVREHVRKLACLPIVALMLGPGVLTPASAGAHRARPRASLGEQAPTVPSPEAGGASNESTASTTGGETPTPPPPNEANGPGRREERHARRGARGDSPCGVTLEATPATIAAGATLSLTGAINCPQPSEAGGQTVTIHQRVLHTAGFEVAATTTSAADGSFQVTLTDVQANSVFYASSAQANGASAADGGSEADSASVRIDVLPEITLTAPAAGTQLPLGPPQDEHANAALDGNAVTFSGTVSPDDAGAEVTLQREYRHDAWHRIGGGVVDEAGEYSIPHIFYRPGEATIRVVVHSHGRQMRSASQPVTYEVARRRDRRPTIQAPAETQPPLDSLAPLTPALSR